MSDSDKLSAIFLNQNTNAAKTNARLEAFTERVDSQEKLINDLINGNAILRSEVEQLKDL